VEILHIIIYKPFAPNLTNLKFSYYNYSSGVALLTLLQTMKTGCSAQEPNILLIVAYRKDDHAVESQTNLLMRRTCNKGLTNPKYKSTPQDLTNEKGREDSGMQTQRNQGEDIARNKVLLHKSYK
jgi:hypothetical protein